jgi:hypothetical protein
MLGFSFNLQNIFVSYDILFKKIEHFFFFGEGGYEKISKNLGGYEKFSKVLGGYEKFSKNLGGYEKFLRNLGGYEKFSDFLKNPHTPLPP